MLKTGMFTNNIFNIGHIIRIAENGIEVIFDGIHERVAVMFMSPVYDVLD
jgi:hypothetical protein